MKYRIEINKKAQKFIKSQPRNQQERLLAAIYKLPEGDVKALAGLKDVYRLRVGDYRVIYEIRNDILLITVVNVGNRGQVYTAVRFITEYKKTAPGVTSTEDGNHTHKAHGAINKQNNCTIFPCVLQEKSAQAQGIFAPFFQKGANYEMQKMPEEHSRRLEVL